jgi:hypothetical protein
MNYNWNEEVSKRLVGKIITKVKWLDADNTYKLFGWTHQPCEIHLNDGTILTPSADDEGNGAGAIFTNIKDLQVLPVFREPVSEKTIQQEQKRIKNILDKKVVNE